MAHLNSGHFPNDASDRPPITMVESMELGILERDRVVPPAELDRILNLRRRARWTQDQPGAMPDLEGHAREDS